MGFFACDMSMLPNNPSAMITTFGRRFEDAEIKGCPRISRLIKDLNGEDYFERLEAETLANERRLAAKLPVPVRSEEERSDVSKTIGTEDTPNTWISRRSQSLPPQSGRCWGIQSGRC